MALKRMLVSDMSNRSGARTVSFALHDQDDPDAPVQYYEIDLTSEEEDLLRFRMAEYLSKARKVASPQQSQLYDLVEPPVQEEVRSEYRIRQDRAEIRAWAIENGYEVGRGRFPRDVLDAYNEAHGTHHGEAARKAMAARNRERRMKRAELTRRDKALLKVKRDRIRDWATARGEELAPYGRIPDEIVEAYVEETGDFFSNDIDEQIRIAHEMRLRGDNA